MRATALGLLLLAACCAGPAPRPAPPALHPIAVGGVPARVRIARTAAERRHGLMGVRTLAPDEGMLFLYRTPAPHSIWMAGCHVALDVAFADVHGVVREVVTLGPPGADGAPPARARAGFGVAYVLEMPAGWFARHGLAAGAHLTLPAAADRGRAED